MTVDHEPLRVLVAGATGEVGRVAVAQLLERGARVALAGRDARRLAELSARTGCPAQHIDAYDLDACSAAAPRAAAALGGAEGRLDGVLVTVGAAGFGPAAEVSNAVAEHLMTVNALCPMAVLRGAVPVVRDGGFLAAVTGAVVDAPLTGTSDYAAAKAALACWLGVLSRELRRRRVTVLDARLPHLATGFASRAVAGTPPRLGPGADPQPEVRALLDALVDGAPYPAPSAPDAGRPYPS
jgi:short-subunit dehydrogenase